MRMVAPRTGAPEITIAEDQLEYRPLTAAVYEDQHGATQILTRWKFTDEDKARVAAGEDMYLCILTFGRPLQPLRVQIGPEGYLNEENPDDTEPR